MEIIGASLRIVEVCVLQIAPLGQSTPVLGRRLPPDPPPPLPPLPPLPPPPPPCSCREKKGCCATPGAPAARPGQSVTKSFWALPPRSSGSSGASGQKLSRSLMLIQARAPTVPQPVIAAGVPVGRSSQRSRLKLLEPDAPSW